MSSLSLIAVNALRPSNNAFRLDLPRLRGFFMSKFWLDRRRKRLAEVIETSLQMTNGTLVRYELSRQSRWGFSGIFAKRG